MNKRKGLRAFQQIQAKNSAYHISQFTPQEQAIREHVRRGFVDPRRYKALDELALLDQRNKI